MPANLTPEYKAADAAFRKARDLHERLDCLREMLRVIPKHKGTDHLQGDIKRRIKELADELDRPKKGGARGGPALVIRPEGAAQLMLVGPPNSGKSSLHARLTSSAARVAPYPFTTQHPEPGMMPYEDIHFQLVDLPPIAPEHAVPWIASALQTADGVLLVDDLAEADCVDRVESLQTILRERHVTLTESWDADASGAVDEEETEALMLRLPTMLIANKSDRLDDPEAELRAFGELTGLRWPALAVSATSGHGLGDIGAWLFEHLRIVRVHTKVPGKPADRSRPFTIRRGQTVADVARLVHGDLARSLKHARLWGTSGYDGQHVGPEHVLADGDVIELH
jgi:ribosome-interacting GTPase 1